MNLIVIEPEHLVVDTGYESRLIQSEKKFFDFQNAEDREFDTERFVETTEEGAVFNVDGLQSALWVVNTVYLQEKWYCTCFCILEMTYDTETKTLRVELDSESG